MSIAIRNLGELPGVEVLEELVPSEIYERRPPTRLHFADDAAQAWRPYFDKTKGRLPPQRLYRIADLLALGKGTMLVDRSILRENIEGAPMAAIQAELARQWPEPVRVIDEPLLYTTRYGVKNYGHCLTDILPRVIAATRAMPGLRVALHPEFVSTAVEAMNLLGLAPGVLCSLDEQPTLLRQGRYVSPCNAHPLVHSPTALAMLRECIAPAQQQVGPAPTGGKLFVTRSDATTRRLGNHGAVAKRLQELGFEEIAMGGRSFADQVVSFANAREVVGIAGAALTNMVFCAPGTRVTILSPSSMSALYFWDLAAQLGLDIGVGYFPAAHPGRGIHADFSAPVADIERLLRD